MQDKLKILIVDDVRTDAEILRRTLSLSKFKFTSEIALNKVEFHKQFEAFKPDVVLSDYQMGQFNGMDVVAEIHAKELNIPVIIVTGSLDEETAVQCIQHGAADYVIKEHLARLSTAVESAIEKAEMVREKLKSESLRIKSLCELTERVKELKCLFAVIDIIQTNTELSEIFQEIVNVIPSGLQYPELTRAKLTFNDQEYTSEYFEPTEWKLECCIKVEGMPEGKMEVYYIQECPLEEIGPFFTEDQDLLNAICRTISEFISRKNTEESLRLSEKLFRSSIEQSNDAIYILSEGRFELINRRFSELLGVSQQEVKAPDFSMVQLVAPESRAMIIERDKLHEQGKNVDSQYEFVAQTASGEHLNIEVSVSEISYLGRMAVFGILRNVTDRIRLEAQFRQAQKMESVGRLAGGVAHDFNNILTIISGHTQLIMMDVKGDDPVYEGLTEILEASDRASNLTRQLLAFSRSQKLELCTISPNQLINNLSKMLIRLISEEIEFKADLADNLWNINADAGQIEQVLINLAVNAKDAMPTGGKLKIKTINIELREEYSQSNIILPCGLYVEVRVSDTGTGIPEGMRDKIFDPFFTTKEKGKGTGLGLSTVYGIVKQCGGEIIIESEIGKGTTFRLIFPAVEAEAIDITNIVRLDLPRGSETILIAEDDDALRTMMNIILTKQGYKVLQANDGKAALALCQILSEPIDLVISDVVMPKMRGQELVKNIHEMWPDVKVIYMSGYTAEECNGVEESKETFYFMQKPFRPVDLSWKVRRALDGSN